MSTHLKSTILTAAVVAASLFPLRVFAEDAWKLPVEKTVLKDGAGKELVVGQCFLCHSTDYIATQPSLTRAQWQATVEKMRGKFGAPVPTNAIPTIVDYLTAGYGKPMPAK